MTEAQLSFLLGVSVGVILTVLGLVILILLSAIKGSSEEG